MIAKYEPGQIAHDATIIHARFRLEDNLSTYSLPTEEVVSFAS